MRLSAARQAEYTEYYRGEMKKYQAENERLRAALRSIVEAEAGERRAPLNSYEQCPYCLHMHGLAEQALEANGA